MLTTRYLAKAGLHASRRVRLSAIVAAAALGIVTFGALRATPTAQTDWELYDMAADRVERNNLAASRPDLVKTLGAQWDAWAKRANVDPWTGARRLPWGDDARPGARPGGPPAK